MENKTLELMEKMYERMQQGFSEIRQEMNSGLNELREEMNGGFTELREDLNEVKQDLNEVKQRVINIENDHGKRLAVLFDGYIQNTNKLDRITEEVSKHEEIILRRVK